jgi:hypothetical protein
MYTAHSLQNQASERLPDSDRLWVTRQFNTQLRALTAQDASCSRSQPTHFYQVFQEHIHGDTARLQADYTMGRPYRADRDTLSDISGLLWPATMAVMACA